MSARNGFNAADYQRRVLEDAQHRFGTNIEDVDDDVLQPWLEQHWDAEMRRLGI